MKASKLLILLAFAGVWIWLNIIWQLQYTLPVDLEGKDISLTGQVVELPEHFDNTQLRFILNPISATSAGNPVNITGLVRLTWYKNPPKIRAGEIWQFETRLKAPHGLANPGGIDYEARLFRQGIIATGSVHNIESAHRISTAKFSILTLREYLNDKLINNLPTTPGSGIIIASLLGNTDRIGTASWNILTRAGISHLIAISGFNISLIGGIGFWLVRASWRRSAALCHVLTAPQAGAFGGILLASGYAVLTGFPVSTTRALLMFALLQIALLIKRIARPIHGFVLVLITILFIDPFAVITPGFWLSFAAVALLFYGFGSRLKSNNWLWIWIWVRSQWLMFLGLSPILVLWFGQLSLISPIINLIAVPAFGLLLPLMLGATLLALVTNWFLPLSMLAQLLDQSLLWLGCLVTPAWVNVFTPILPWWIWLGAFFGIILLLAPRGLPMRWAGIPLILSMWLWRPASVEPGALHITIVDVGQGLAAILQTNSHVLVYDTGPVSLSGSSAAETALVPVLHSRDIHHIDQIIVSHADQDHAGGLPGLLAHIAAENILSGDPVGVMANNPNIQVQQCVAGQTWDWDRVHFTILSPNTPRPINSNDSSCVLRVQALGGEAILFTGDLSQNGERALVEYLGDKLRSQVLVAGHHGSNSSTSQEFLNFVRPQWVLISAGYRNRYRFPRYQVLERILRTGAKVANTANSGALEIWFNTNGTLQGPFAYRQTHARPWTHQSNMEQIYRL